MIYRLVWIVVLCTAFQQCSKKSGQTIEQEFDFSAASVNGESKGLVYNETNVQPVIRFTFDAEVKPSSVDAAVQLREKNNSAAVAFNASLENSGRTIVIQPAGSLKSFTEYTVAVTKALQSESGAMLGTAAMITLITGLDSSDKFARIAAEELLTLVQRQTFKYFWDFAHPVSGMARERNSSGDVVTSGGTGFGVMAIVAAVHRGFISRAEAVAHLNKMVDFLLNSADRFHGAFPHWLNGATGETVPFSEKDDGADLVETSFLIQGLLTARQYFDGAGAEEMQFREGVNQIWNDVEWNWFTNNENILFWHWSPNFDWQMNHRIRGWNECLVTYVLAASSPDHAISKEVYDLGWASAGGIANNNTYYGRTLPLGPPQGGPLFFAHYSFLGIDPRGLTDVYADYWEQNTNHTLINYSYCVSNPKDYFGYSEDVWGLTASDNRTGYSAHSPTNDLGVITPTAALSSFPYTPERSMRALEFFYYKLGDRIWKEFGFTDAFNLSEKWFAGSFLAIDQGPIIVMIENYRSGLLWEQFMSCPEIKTGMLGLGFQSPAF